MIRRATLLAIFLTVAGPAAAQPDGGFSLPIACPAGMPCIVMNYPDVGGDGARDHACGPRSYAGHKGTDFAVPDMKTMRMGVSVLAAAPGTVKRIRDAMPDFLKQGRDALATVDGRDCGNGVLIDHGDGWESQYCHMRRGSVTVKPGDVVARGAKLGLVGASGRTAFPHIHLSIRKDGKPVDPATGRALDAPCGPGGESLWRADARLPYQPVVLYAAGFMQGAVEGDRIKEDATARTHMPPEASSIVLWGALFGVRAGDRVTLEIHAPGGGLLLRHGDTLKADKAWSMHFGGKRRTVPRWSVGQYEGVVRLERPGAEPPFVLERRATVTVE